MTNACTVSDLSATKTVRLTMETAETMLQRWPNLRIIHLIRDPRPVALSRMQDSTYHGKRTGGDMVKEARFYCQSVVRDILVRERIQARKPGAVMEVIYEDLTAQPIEVARKIYSFLNETLPQSVKAWLEKSTHSSGGNSKSSVAIASKWKTKMSYGVAQDIIKVCGEFYKMLPGRWEDIG